MAISAWGWRPVTAESLQILGGDRVAGLVSKRTLEAASRVARIAQPRFDDTEVRPHRRVVSFKPHRTPVFLLGNGWPIPTQQIAAAGESDLCHSGPGAYRLLEHRLRPLAVERAVSSILLWSNDTEANEAQSLCGIALTESARRGTRTCCECGCSGWRRDPSSLAALQGRAVATTASTVLGNSAVLRGWTHIAMNEP